MSVDVIGILGIVGLFIAIAVPVYWWERPLLRVVPFLYATMFSVLWFGGTAESYAKMALNVLVINVVTGALLFFAWFEARK